ncbi:transcriptional regulator (TetR/AcrR family) protein [Fulvimarina pelagi HTCC2506]|uniref:Transcriptional regulator (TetR/AcrR family) protein n=1 Tax=Fulvimarina pelagi HTCC2506 TaxID=314231 RepID=Q0G3G6_9HYPH|nr:TetR/AcrR family transcriptional regulator [Fulvimarina pelagi]EAU41865.1 transcriptional regulator (TetR/AcrR family) protein [Fulvimarina pelagi HTCC2506]
MVKSSREQIIIASRDLIREKGYAGTSMQDVAERVGLLKGSLYTHVKNKGELVSEVLALTYAEIFTDVENTGDWRYDFERALGGLVETLTEGRRCIGFQLAYSYSGMPYELRSAVKAFFDDIHAFFIHCLRQGLDDDIAERFARECIIAVEGATLYLVLERGDAAVQAVKVSLLERADGLAMDFPDPEARRLLDATMGDWRWASVAEKTLALRAVKAERNHFTAQCAQTDRVAAENCVR